MRLSTLLRSAANSMNSSLRTKSAQQLAFLDADHCIVVDENDRIVGGATKREVHHRSTIQLHRAFSVFAFTPSKQLILQKRAASKVTFPSLWTNTCCSHPLTGMTVDETDGEKGVMKAAVRKLDHELNLAGVTDTELMCMGRFLYKAAPEGVEWVEHELDYALVLRSIDESRVASPNDDEVESVRFVGEEELNEWMKKEPTQFSPWFTHFCQIGVLSQWWARLNDTQALQALKTNAITRMN